MSRICQLECLWYSHRQPNNALGQLDSITKRSDIYLNWAGAKMETAIDKWIECRNAAEQALARQKYEDAEDSWLGAIEEAKRQQKRPRLITSLLGLFSLYWHLQQHDDALPVATELMNHYENDFGKDCLNVGIMSKSVAQLNQLLGRHAVAEGHFRVALRILRKSLAITDPALVDLLACYATTLKALGRQNEALAMTKLINSRSLQDFSPPALQGGPDRTSTLQH
jgi:tetratricopeptide (TPR) repeat protein